MRGLLQQYPIQSPVLRKEAVGADLCPECGGVLDRGKVCIHCLTDWHKYVPARYKWTPSGGDDAGN